MTSQDFKYAWLHVLDPETAATYAYIISTFVKGADEYNTDKAGPEAVAIETPDDKTLSVELISKSPFFLQLTSFVTYFPQQQEFVEKMGDKYAQDGDSLLYNGPYTMTAGSAGGGSTVVLQKNEKYWDKANVAVKTINGRIVKDERHRDQPLRGRGAGHNRPRRVTRSSSSRTAPTSSGGSSPLPSTGG